MERVPTRFGRAFGLVVAALTAIACAGSGTDGEHDGHDHDGDHDAEAAATVARTPDGPHDDHDDDAHAAEAVVAMSAAEIEAAGVRTATAGGGTLRAKVRLPGEIRVNADRLVRIAPRVGGIVTDVRTALGETVQPGEVMAVLTSLELAEAKAAYLAARERHDLERERFEREQRLWEKKVTPEQEFLEVRQALAEARIELRTAAQRLHVIGLSEERLRRLWQEADETFPQYELLAPAAGTVVEKRLAVGDTIQAGDTPFTIADLTTVWAMLTVHERGLATLGVGTAVELSAGRGTPSVEGLVDYLDPIVDERTRAASARVVLSNHDGRWRPGTFVTATAAGAPRAVAVLVPGDAVQTIDGETVVFVREDDGRGFAVVPVRAGATGDGQVEILHGLQPGQPYVAEGAFALKAKVVTSSMDAHAGHGH